MPRKKEYISPYDTKVVNMYVTKINTELKQIGKNFEQLKNGTFTISMQRRVVVKLQTLFRGLKHYNDKLNRHTNGDPYVWRS